MSASGYVFESVRTIVWVRVRVRVRVTVRDRVRVNG